VRSTARRQLAKPFYATATHADASVTVPASAGYVVVRSFAWSYSGGTPTGRLLIESPQGVTCFDIDITAQGPGICTPEFSTFEPGKILVVTLKDGGSGIIGKLTVFAYAIGSDGYQVP
jgi:hypothetical protein